VLAGGRGRIRVIPSTKGPENPVNGSYRHQQSLDNSSNRSHCGEYLAAIANRLVMGGLLGNLR
jgi:hypothetical protein